MLDESEKEMLRSMLPALKQSRVMLDEIESVYSKRKGVMDGMASSVSRLVGAFTGTHDEIKDLESALQGKSIEIIGVPPSTSLDGDRPVSGREKLRAKFREMAQTGEVTAEEVCNAVGITYTDNKGEFSTLFKGEEGAIGRRKQKRGRSFAYVYASREWYVSKGIEAAYTIEDDIPLQE